MVSERLKNIIRVLFNINWLKTIRFNLKYFSWNYAKMLPVYIYRKTEIRESGGTISINCRPTRGMIKIGSDELGTIDIKNSRAIWKVSGKVNINGNVTLGRGTKISVGKNGKLNIGAGLVITGNTAIICHKEINIGGGVLISWDCLVMDSDQHIIISEDEKCINQPRNIHIGDDVWIGCRSTVLKGVQIPNHSIIAASSLLTKSFTEENTVIGGCGSEQKVLRHNVHWKR